MQRPPLSIPVGVPSWSWRFLRRAQLQACSGMMGGSVWSPQCVQKARARSLVGQSLSYTKAGNYRNAHAQYPACNAHVLPKTKLLSAVTTKRNRAPTRTEVCTCQTHCTPPFRLRALFGFSNTGASRELVTLSDGALLIDSVTSCPGAFLTC